MPHTSFTFNLAFATSSCLQINLIYVPYIPARHNCVPHQSFANTDSLPSLLFLLASPMSTFLSHHQHQIGTGSTQKHLISIRLASCYKNTHVSIQMSRLWFTTEGHRSHREVHVETERGLQ